jgi:hypothetical protein
MRDLIWLVLASAAVGVSTEADRGFYVDPKLHSRKIVPAAPKPLTKRQKRRLRGKK